MCNQKKKYFDSLSASAGVIQKGVDDRKVINKSPDKEKGVLLAQMQQIQDEQSEMMDTTWHEHEKELEQLCQDLNEICINSTKIKETSSQTSND